MSGMAEWVPTRLLTNEGVHGDFLDTNGDYHSLPTDGCNPDDPGRREVYWCTWCGFPFIPSDDAHPAGGAICRSLMTLRGSMGAQP